MAVKSVLAFFEKVGESKALQAKLKALHKKTLKETKKINDQASAEVVKIAAAAGSKFTAKDLAKARGAAAKLAGSQMSEVEAQSAVVAGYCYSVWACKPGWCYY